jgi:hypothetical protein
MGGGVAVAEHPVDLAADDPLADPLVNKEGAIMLATSTPLAWPPLNFDP